MSAQVGDQWRISMAERVREAMGSDFRAVADKLRTDFGAKLSWFECPSFTVGNKIDSEPIGEKGWRAR